MANIKFYPFSQATMDFADPPQPASKFTPSWYKKQPGTINDEETLPKGFSTVTVKKCMPIFDLMTAGYIITAPCDIHLDATDPNNLSFTVPMPIKQFQADMFASHGFEQYSEYPMDRETDHPMLLRILPFWSVKTDPGYSCLFMHPAHADSSPLTAMQALVDTDKFISEGHLSFVVRKGFKGVVKQGTPLVQVIPFKRESWSSEIVEPELSKQELTSQRLSLRSTFANGYKIKFRSKKEYK